MRILFADAFHPDYAQVVADRGHDCSLQPGLSSSDLAQAVVGFDALIVRSTRVRADTLAASDRLGLIIRAGAGTNTIDVAAAAERGIYVCNVPGRNAVAVAELTLGLILSLDRRIPDNVADLRDGCWHKQRYAQARGLLGRALGIVGLGDIGLAVAERAAAFGLRVHAIARSGRPAAVQARAARAGVTWVDDLAALAATCDIVSFHVPLTESTRGMVDRTLLGHLRPGSWIINTSRGEIVDDAALLEALDTRDLRAGLDVYNDEPGGSTGRITSPLAQHPHVYGTHHIGASTDQAQRAIAAEVVEIIDAYERGEVRNCVNLEERIDANATLLVRHVDEVGVLAQVLEVLRHHQLNVEQMHNTVLAGRRAAVATIHCAGAPPPDLGAQIDAISQVIDAKVWFGPGHAHNEEVARARGAPA
jgi:D-3-phosphoglycerate dehydrogenase